MTLFSEDYRRRLRALEDAVRTLSRLLQGIRSERRPRLGRKQEIFDAVISEAGGLAAGGSGEAVVYDGLTPTDWRVEVHNKWMHGDQAHAYDTECRIRWNDTLKRFDLHSVGCAPCGDHDPLPAPE